MGTRNITFVIRNGEKKVAQYCQWDGYPTGRGAEVLKFVHGLFENGRLNMFEDRISNSTLEIAGEYGERSVTGAPWRPDTSERLFQIVEKECKNPYNPFSFMPFEDQVESALSSHKITQKEADYLIVASRDTGNKVLDYLMNHCEYGMKFYSDNYVYNMEKAGDWQIEGVFEINLDTYTVEIWFHGRCKRYSFIDVAGMTDEEIDDRMKEFEEGDPDE